MSKIQKFFTSPRLFLGDARKKSALRMVDVMSGSEMARFGRKSPRASSETESNSAEKPRLRIAPKPTSKPKHGVKTKPRTKDLELARKLINFELSNPVNKLKAELPGYDVLLWPLLRHLFWVRCQAFYKGKDPADINTSKFFVPQEWQHHYKNQLPVYTLETLPASETDYLFFTNLRGTEQTRVDKKIYNRITDPIYEVARTIGRAKKVEVLKSVGEIYPHRMHEVDVVLPPLLRTTGYAAMTDKPKDFIDRVGKLLPEVKFTENHYNDFIEWFFHQKNFYTKLLKRYNPKVVFFVGFDYHYALICAAKSLNIHTVDLQHGVQAGWSPVYNHWQTVPTQGYEMLPDTFWVWGQYDAARIQDNFPKQSVNALVGGFPWLDRQQDFIDEKLPDNLKKLSSKKKVALLTLQDQTSFPVLFEQIIEKTSKELDWIIKRHPKHLKIDLSNIEKKARYGKKIDSVSFLTLIGVADIHLTECSTAVIEADYFGVPSVVTGEQGMQNYTDFIEQGTVFHIEDPNEFSDQLEHFLAAGGEANMGVVDNSVIEAALHSLLEKNNV